MGGIWKKNDDYKKYGQNNNNEYLNLVNNYLSISNTYYKQKNYRIAGKYVDSAIKLSRV